MTSIDFPPTEEQMATYLHRARHERSQAMTRGGRKLWAVLLTALGSIAHGRRPVLTDTNVKAA